MDADITKAVQLKLDHSFLNSFLEDFKTGRTTPKSLRTMMSHCPFIDYSSLMTLNPDLEKIIPEVVQKYGVNARYDFVYGG